MGSPDWLSAACKRCACSKASFCPVPGVEEVLEGGVGTWLGFRCTFVAIVVLRCVALARDACERILRRFDATSAAEPRPPRWLGFHAIKLLSRSMNGACGWGARTLVLPSDEFESDISRRTERGGLTRASEQRSGLGVTVTCQPYTWTLYAESIIQY